MEPWVWVTFAAVTAQTVRFMLQKQLSSGRLSASGATWARFVYSVPLAALALVLHGRASGQPLPVPPAGFWPWAVAGGVTQILATVCMMLLFRRRNFAVGVTFKKTEVILSVLASLVLLGEGVSGPAFLAICVGLVGVLLLSDMPGGTARGLRRLWNVSAGLGLASGLFFALSGVGYRAATLALPSGDAGLRALTGLACVTAVQTVLLGVWLLWREPGEIGRVFGAWRIAALVGLTSAIGSGCWFAAFSLQKVGYVNAVGQAELILSLAVSALVFRERITARELTGVAVLTVSIVALILLT
ncbi:DMT family transporter [Wenxinia marina]|uniref:Putative membrane protein n=1 Tax=Wenxinia marina DSM 24838 TaxID=1123501 RepID=A0A0D0QFG1_9RHOB|nr:DMT family transporter [Wenxinia marina]KIQ69703.1 putative membrane protein [Wenxinia marina DSM 24838]GGL60538.1 membrane protein [Wenxinia marina]